MQSVLVILPSLLDILRFQKNSDDDGRPLPEWTLMNARLSNRLKVARAESGMSQSDLAASVGVTRQTISSIETGQYCPSTLLAFLIAEALQKRIDDLFMLEGNER